jgi:hypothetical protein
MSQRDLAYQLRVARPAAPPELRERVRLIAAQSAQPPRRRITWRRVLVVAVPVAAALVAASVLSTRSARNEQQLPLAAQQAPALHRKAAFGAAADTLAPAPAPNAARLQRYSTSLELRVRNADDISEASKRAVAIARALGGYEQTVDVDTANRTGYAHITLRVPKTRVQEAVRRLATLGTIVSESVRVQDLQAQVNATDRLIARLQKRLADLRPHYQDTQTQQQEAALESRIEKLQRGRAATVRTAHYATVDLQLTTRTPPPPVHRGHGPLHDLGLIFRWLGIGAVYVVALGAPFVIIGIAAWLLVRSFRRRREEALLSRS